MAQCIQVLTTTSTEEEAHRIAEDLIHKRLAACVQITGPGTSVYRWKGKVEKDEEWFCSIKTDRMRYEKVEKAIQAIHTYETPEIIALEIITGSVDYIDWVQSTVKTN